MSLPDAAMQTYYKLLLGEALDAGRAPVEAKRALARRIVERFWGPEAAPEAEAHFDRVHKQHLPPEEMEELAVSDGHVSDGRAHLPAVIADAFGISRSEARRRVGQGGVRLDGEPLAPDELDLPVERLDGSVLQVGRRQFRRLRIGA
jgi:tyrosyl-tRNA synthetase